MLVEDKQTSVEYTENIETVKEDRLKTMTLFMRLKFFCSLCSLIFSPELVVWMLKLPARGKQN